MGFSFSRKESYTATIVVLAANNGEVMNNNDCSETQEKNITRTFY
jgi:hypothetical protein